MSDAKVVFEYEADADDELTLKEGDLIKDIVKKEDGWWEGELHGRRGMFPENFVQEIKKAMPDPREEKPFEKPIVTPKEANTASVAKVTFDYIAENDDELSLKEGEIVKVLNQEEEGWWKGELNGKIGVFPTNFVELVKGPIPATEPAQPVAEPSFKEPAEKVETPEKKPKMMGGMGFGVTQGDLSVIKLRKSNSAANISPNNKTEKPSESSELSKKLSMKRKQPPLKSTSKPKERALVEFEYDGEQSDELTLKKGDVVTILEKGVNEGWWKGELNGKVGLFPDNFVKLLPPEEPKKETDTSKVDIVDNMASSKKGPIFEDIPDAKPSRPEFPHPKKKPPTERPPPPHPELPLSLKPVPKPVEEITKKTEPPPLESKPEEKAPKPQEKPPKKFPPSLPRKPDKPKPLSDGLQTTKDQPPSPLTSRKPAVVLRHTDHLDKDPSKRKSEVIPREMPNDVKIKRNSQGSDVMLNLNDIRSTSVLQPLTTDRPKNPAKNPPTKYGRPHSPTKKINTPEERNGEPGWLKEAKEVIKPVEKPKKPAMLESPKPKITESTMDSKEVKKLQDEINAFKDSLGSITKDFKEHVQKSEKRFQKMEKKLSDEIEDITRELDEEKKARSAVDVEVNRLRKLIRSQLSS